MREVGDEKEAKSLPTVVAPASRGSTVPDCNVRDNNGATADEDDRRERKTPNADAVALGVPGPAAAAAATAGLLAAPTAQEGATLSDKEQGQRDTDNVEAADRVLTELDGNCSAVEIYTPTNTDETPGKEGVIADKSGSPRRDVFRLLVFGLSSRPCTSICFFFARFVHICQAVYAFMTAVPLNQSVVVLRFLLFLSAFFGALRAHCLDFFLSRKNVELCCMLRYTGWGRRSDHDRNSRGATLRVTVLRPEKVFFCFVYTGI